MKARGLSAAFLLVAAALSAQTGATEPAPPRVFSIVGATIHPVSGPDIPKGTIEARLAASTRSEVEKWTRVVKNAKVQVQ